MWPFQVVCRSPEAINCWIGLMQYVRPPCPGDAPDTGLWLVEPVDTHVTTFRTWSWTLIRYVRYLLLLTKRITRFDSPAIWISGFQNWNSILVNFGMTIIDLWELTKRSIECCCEFRMSQGVIVIFRCELNVCKVRLLTVQLQRLPYTKWIY